MSYQNEGPATIDISQFQSAGPSSVVTPEEQFQVSKYETALPMRLDLEAALTYSLGCITGIGFLIFEWKSDYVRFHAWQSCLVFLPLLVLHVLFIWSSVISWILFVADVLLAGWLGFKAYQNGQTLDRYQVPFLGSLANKWTDAEEN